MTAAVQTTRRPSGRGPRVGSSSSALWANGLLIIGVAYMLLPLLWVVFASTKSITDLYATGAFEFGGFALFTNIGAVLAESDGIFVRWMANSLMYSGVGAVVGGFISVMAGYGFDKYRFRFRSQLFAVVLIGVLIPTTATVLPLYLLAAQFGLTNTIWSVLIPVLCNPFGVYLARVFAGAYVPDETLEAARVDGAGPIRTFLLIGFPMMTPGFVTIALFQFVGIWNNFMLPLVMINDRSILPVSVGMTIWQSYTPVQPHYTTFVITGATLSIIPLVVAFIALQRFWRAGLLAGSVK